MEMPRRFEAEPPRRVLLVGNRGSGREALAEQISLRFGMPVIDLDLENPGASPEPARRDAIAAQARGSDWVIVGGELELLDTAIKRADWFIWLDLPTSTCVAAVIRQAFQLRGISREKARQGAKTTLAMQIREVLHFPAVTPRIIGLVERERRNRTIFILRSKHDVRQFMSKLPPIAGMGPNLTRNGKPAK